jgi:nitric oxide reductase NorD protein
MKRRDDLLSAVTGLTRRVKERVSSLFPIATARVTARRPGIVRLDDIRRRLELLVTAVYDRPIPITSAEPVPRRTRMRRLLGLEPPGPHPRSLATTDGQRIQLPREIEATNADAALGEYRLMAIEQAERIARGTTARVPAGATSIERDLYLLREGEIVDAAIVRLVPGLRATLAESRERALASRPSLRGLTSREQFVERLVRRSLGTSLTSSEVSVAASPDDSLQWARARMQEMQDVGGRYRGIAPVPTWGTVKPRSGEDRPIADDLASFKGSKFGVGSYGRGTGEDGTKASDAGLEDGASQFRRDRRAVLHDQGPRRVQSGDGAGSPEPDHGGDIDDGEMAERREEPTHEDSDATRRVARSVQGAARSTGRVPVPKTVEGGIEYPEWDCEAGDYRALGAVVRPYEAEVTDDTWGDTVLARHGALVRRLRERFDRLRARRTRLTQQRDGDELDLTACVRAWVDQRTGQTIDDRLYIATRPARRGLAITLLIDVSGSTDEWIDSRRRVIDVEKIALLLASEALDALGDLYAILTFSGKGRGNVRMRTIKAFDESNGRGVRRRIGALGPEGYTRAGAAIRHAAALLERQPAAHRLLLIISDGKPNDVDAYEGLSGVEDTRQAINEARRQGVFPFCLTIDRQGQEYLGRIFGEAGHTVLRNPQQLPMALVKVVKHLLVS